MFLHRHTQPGLGDATADAETLNAALQYAHAQAIEAALPNIINWLLGAGLVIAFVAMVRAWHGGPAKVYFVPEHAQRHLPAAGPTKEYFDALEKAAKKGYVRRLR